MSSAPQGHRNDVQLYRAVSHCRALWRSRRLQAEATPWLCHQRIMGIEYHISLSYQIDTSSDQHWGSDGEGGSYHGTKPLFICWGFNFKTAEVNFDFLFEQVLKWNRKPFCHGCMFTPIRTPSITPAKFQDFSPFLLQQGMEQITEFWSREA